MQGSLNAQWAVENNNGAVRIIDKSALVLIPALGALYCSIDKQCTDPAGTFVGMLNDLLEQDAKIEAENQKQLEEMKAKFGTPWILSSNNSNEEKNSTANQSQNNSTVQAATGSPQIEPPEPDDEKKTSSIDHIVKDRNGEFVGNVNKGATENIRTVSQQEFQQIKHNLLKDAKEIGKYSNGRGTWYQLPNGDRFGIRGSNRYGETLDFDVKGLPRDFKIHQK